MASGRNHDRSILFATPIVLAVGSYLFGLEVGVIAAASHFLGGYWLSPDLDIKSAPFLRWGILRFIWLPYQKKIPHRHWLSHSPVIGSTIRLLYLAVCLLPLYLAFPDLSRVEWSGVSWSKAICASQQRFAIAFLAGVEMSALNHLLLDGLVIPLPRSVKRMLSGG